MGTYTPGGLYKPEKDEGGYAGLLNDNWDLLDGLSPSTTSMDLTVSSTPGTYGRLWRATVPNGTGLTLPWRPFYFQNTITATDLPVGAANLGLDSTVTYGTSGTAATGTAEAITGDVLVQGVNDNNVEFAVLAGSIRYAGDPFPFASPGRAWIQDMRLHGPIGVRADLLSGYTMFMNNYHNSSPIHGSVGVAVNTFPGVAGPSPHNTKDTYALDIGVHVAGAAGSTGSPTTRQGFATAFKAGGSGIAWNGITASRLGVGFLAQDFETAGLQVGNGFTGSTGAAIKLAGTSGATYGIDSHGSTYSGGAIRLGNAQKIVARNAADSGDIEMMQLNSSSVTVINTAHRFTSTALGFYGTTAQTKQTVTGAKGGNAALGSLLTALSTIGLITDSSSA